MDDKNCRTCLDLRCAECPEWEFCIACKENTNEDCTCIENYFYLEREDSCEKCYETCAVCDGVSSAQCISCMSGYFLHLGVCLDQCPYPYTSNNSQRSCDGSPGAIGCLIFDNIESVDGLSNGVLFV